MTCIQIKKDWLHAPKSPVPQIGDLVMYYKKSAIGDDIEKEVGHLYELEYIPGNEPKGKINISSGLKSFSLKDLIIIEKAKKQQ